MTLASKLNTRTTKLGTNIIPTENRTNRIKFSTKNKSCYQWGLREMEKTYNPSGALDKVTYTFSAEPKEEKQVFSGTKDQARMLWKAITGLGNKEDVSDYLKILHDVINSMNIKLFNKADL